VNSCRCEDDSSELVAYPLRVRAEERARLSDLSSGERNVVVRLEEIVALVPASAVELERSELVVVADASSAPDGRARMSARKCLDRAQIRSLR
jgi:hypothetical protein